jgi:hypothetical protein
VRRTSPSSFYHLWHRRPNMPCVRRTSVLAADRNEERPRSDRKALSPRNEPLTFRF